MVAASNEMVPSLFSIARSRSTRVFYGWWIAGTTFVSLFVMVGLVFYGLPQFYPELLKEFHWSRTALTAPFAVSVMLIGPFAGSLIDRFGPKRAMLLGVIGAAVAFAGFSRMRSLAGWFVFTFINIVGYMLGGPVPSQVLVSRWFRRLRGRVMGTAYLGIGVGGAIAPLLATWGIEHLGWRRSLLYGAVIIATLLLPMVSWVVRERPEELGQHPDGDPAPPADAAARPISLRAVAARPSFWFLAGGYFFSVAAIGAVIVHLELFLAGERFTRWQAGWVFTLLLIASNAGRVVMGFLADRLSNEPVMIAAFLMVGGSIPLLYLTHVPGMIYLFATIFGFGMGADYLMIPLVAAECFGVNSLGRVMGVLLPIASVGQALCPMLVGWMFDHFGNYHAAFAVMTALGALAVVCATRVRPPTAVVQR